MNRLFAKLSVNKQVNFGADLEKINFPPLFLSLQVNYGGSCSGEPATLSTKKSIKYSVKKYLGGTEKNWLIEAKTCISLLAPCSGWNYNPCLQIA